MSTPNIFDHAYDLFEGIDIEAAPGLYSEEIEDVEGYLIEDYSRFNCLVVASDLPKNPDFHEEFSEVVVTGYNGRRFCVWVSSEQEEQEEEQED